MVGGEQRRRASVSQSVSQAVARGLYGRNCEYTPVEHVVGDGVRRSSVLPQGGASSFGVSNDDGLVSKGGKR